MRDRLDSAQKFHEDLGSYGHPNTFAIWSSGLSTDEAVDFTGINLNPVVIPKVIKTASGDGTVHKISGDCSGIGSANIKGSREFQGVEHAKCFDNHEFNLQIIRFINQPVSVP
jgi:hypothetical protein